MKIFERDRWVCQLCSKKIKRDVVAPHLLAPTIDHIVPLARGGTHEPANAQAAHFICNTRKSDRGGHEQLPMIG
jgi:5-methylcytosine-specific restriction endonuclease McrA